LPADGLCERTTPTLFAGPFLYSVRTVSFAPRSAARAAGAFCPTTFGTEALGRLEPTATPSRTTLPIFTSVPAAGSSCTIDPGVPEVVTGYVSATKPAASTWPGPETSSCPTTSGTGAVVTGTVCVDERVVVRPAVVVAVTEHEEPDEEAGHRQDSEQGEPRPRVLEHEAGRLRRRRRRPGLRRRDLLRRLGLVVGHRRTSCPHAPP